MPLITFHGNAGSPQDPPADPRYTDIELSPLGYHVALGEAGRAQPLPIGLVNGDQYAGGLQPSFAPSAVARALTSLADTPTIDDATLIEQLGPPVSPSGCMIDGPMPALFAGRPAALTLTAMVDQRGPRQLEVSRLPPVWDDIGPYVDYLPRGAGISTIKDLSNRDRVLYALELEDTADIGALIDRLRSSWPFHVEVHACLAGPWREMATQWLDSLSSTKHLASHLRLLTNPATQEPGLEER